MENHLHYQHAPHYATQQTYDENAIREYEISLFPELSDNNPDSALISQIMSRPHGYTSPSSSTDEDNYIETNSNTNQMSNFSNVNLPVTTPTVSARTTTQITSGPYLEVNLQHKPRGSKGLWQNIDPGQRIRVTKLKGKRLKLEIKILGASPNEISSAFRLDKLQVHLLQYENDETPSICSDGFTIESLKTTRNITELEVKVFKVFCKRLQFLVQIPAVDDTVLRGSSTEFATHNSGTLTGTKDKTKQAASYDSSDRSSPSPPGPVVSAPPREPAPQQPDPRFFAPPHLTGPPPPYYPEPIPEMKRKRVEEVPYPTDNLPVTVVPGSLDVKGAVRARAYMQFSDARLKTNFSDIVDAISIVTSLKGQSYEWKPELMGEEMAGKRVIGLIAQEVQKVLPEVVHKDVNTGYLSVSYAEILPVLIDAFNQFLLEYKQDKTDLNSQVENLKMQVNELSANLAKTQKAREEHDMQGLLDQVCFLSRELLRTQEKQHKIEKTLISTSPDSPNISPRGSHTSSDGSSGDATDTIKYTGYGRYYQYLTGMFSLSVVGVIIGIVLLATEGSPYTSHLVATTTTGETNNQGTGSGSTKGGGKKPTTTTDTSSTNLTSILTSGTTSSNAADAITVVETNQGYVVGAILLSVGVIGIIASVGLAIFRFRRDKGLNYSKTNSV